MTALLEAFAISHGGSEGGIGRVCAETLAQMQEFDQVVIITAQTDPPVPENCVIYVIPANPLWLKLAYKLGNTAGPAGKIWNEVAFRLRYWIWLKDAAQKAEELHRQSPIGFALHATYGSLTVGSRLGTTGIPNTASLGSIGGSKWETLAARLQAPGRGKLVALNQETVSLLGGTLAVAPINPPALQGIPKTKGALFLDHKKARKNAVSVRKALKENAETNVTVLTDRPNFWAGAAAEIKPKTDHAGYLKELESHEFLLSVAWREGTPTSALEALHLKTLPIASPLSWTYPLQIIPCGKTQKATPAAIRRGLALASRIPKWYKTRALAGNLAWAKENTGHGALKKALRSLL